VIILELVIDRLALGEFLMKISGINSNLYTDKPIFNSNVMKDRTCGSSSTGER
jgi:hypothetical protein